jgi:uncharacterized protein (UPF0262 family)
MFVPRIIRRSRNDQQYEEICTIALFYILAPTCFDSSLPSSGSFWIRLSYMNLQIGLVGSTADGTTTLRHTGHLTNIVWYTTKPICKFM